MEEAAADALNGAPPIRCTALTVCGRLRARRGQRDADEMLTEAWELALALDECQRIGPAACAVAEAAALAGDPDRARAQVEVARELAAGHGSDAVRAELAYWSLRWGGHAEVGSRHPYALLARGRWEQAAEVWRSAGSVYEAALAATHSADAQILLGAVAELQALGAEPLARGVRHALREQGVSVPRGASAPARVNPAGLTARQLEVARLMAQGLTNPEIADRLVVSVRTVESHAAAVLEKLGLTGRRELARRAVELGIGGG